MCGSMVDIQSARLILGEEKRRKKERKKPQDENIMVCPIPYGDHNNIRIKNRKFYVI